MLESFLYQEREPSSIYVRFYYGWSFLGLCALAPLEIAGVNLRYSKFAVNSTQPNQRFIFSSKIGMLLLYTPALLAGILSFWLFPHGDGVRFLLLKSAMTLHFLKRDIEVLFIHKYSGFIPLDSVFIIMFAYLSSTVSVLYFQQRTLTLGLGEPFVDLKYVGIFVFLVGICGNFYHHYLLSKLRVKGEKSYKIPRGGLFELIICPHYLFEIITFVGVSFIAQTTYSCLFMLGIVAYLSARSHSTLKWYVSKFEDFPKNVKALIPYIF